MSRAQLSCILAGSAFLACVAAPCLAQPAPAPQSTTVFYSDLNLKQPADAKILLKRIRATARSVCGPMPVIADINEMAAFNNCRDTAVEQAVKNVGSPWLTAAYEGRTSPEQLAQADIH